ncbi:MAG TPA: methylenetetrahydrofolate reductase C-terminal domain-containing protein [Anaerolineaceae bacterium]|jgi:methylenetetrahydrofolate reductase (NADPH)|nr:methylenetetrahydrofolate reductase C-terminal domain-containing protein [Anaerolineaceae bacterium]HOE02083.1 methylenetetrahydrofolate reductase C-terminal domain-containing protein [Anaerolineaceae bacterium]HQM55079.1 methylenetetrahydrofolate reductase C-terminal domain-containing protein [Anaerolineaceae bacterium]
MPILTPGRRWQPIFYPFKKDKLGNRLLIRLEMLYKGPLWGCRQCGNCVLQETAFICPMECPKGLRNGPCGGSTPEYCYVDETRPCIWYKIYERAFQSGREELLMEVLPPLDWDLVGGEQLGRLAGQVKKNGVLRVFTGLVSLDKAKRQRTWDGIFRPVRQPVWWRGDSVYHAPKYEGDASELERRLKAGEFVITAEVQPPQTASTNRLKQNIEMVSKHASAVNFTDGASATPRMSSWACSAIASQMGVEAVLQIAARDITRVSLQGTALGAAALGIKNILCVTGDSNRLSPSPRGRMDIYDLDAIQMLWILREMRDEGRYLDERNIKYPPKYFLGAVASPSASEVKFQALREHKKVNAGAQFFQTNILFDLGRFEEWLNALAARNILDKVYILAGISPLRSLRSAQFLNKEVPGVRVPEHILRRMEKADAAGNAQEEGIQVALELIEKLRQYKEVNGLHLMTVGWEEIIPRLVHDAGLSQS